MTFGVPVEPLLQMPFTSGDTTSGSSGTSRVRGGVDPREVVGAQPDDRRDDLAQAGQLPVGDVPAHRDRDGAELPGGEGAQHELRGVAQPDPEPVAGPETPGGQRAGELARPPVQLGPGEGLLLAVRGDVSEHQLVGALPGELADPACVADAYLHL